jgi:2-polyprenyl-6-methoxyphenol hydroxylase-like FAD-dependent oxidoreductase
VLAAGHSWLREWKHRSPGAGLVLAIELASRGVIDKGDGVMLETRAIGLHTRTLEVLDMMGLAERFTEQGQRVREFRWYSSGKRLISITEPS